MSLIYNATFDSQTRILSLLDKAGNVISSCEVPSKELVDDITKPLTFKATQNGSTVKLTKNGSPSGDFQTSMDGGNTWTDYTVNNYGSGASITLNTGDEVSFRAKADRSAQNAGNYIYFQMTGKIEAWHNVMSLYRTNDFATYNTTPGTDTFISLFRDCTSLTKAPVLPATTITDSCYYHMFYGCTSLTEAPALPATTLDRWCYTGMFYGCTSLVNAPELPATTLGNLCYENMFYGCTSLVNAPALPATTLVSGCYTEMFSGCTSLTKAPELPATKLIPNCYQKMFYGCRSLVNAPALPSTTLANGCYTEMFMACTSLTKAPALPVTALYSNCYKGMFRACTSLTEAPALPATTLDDYCYNEMFYGCTSLTEAPELPATTLAQSCYSNMFQGCTSLVNAPALSATTLATSCYSNMFQGCTSLVNAPALSATKLAGGCYSNMFNGCTSLTNAPVLPATTLAQGCYSNMFSGCTSLVNAPALSATKLATSCYKHMFSDCTSMAKAPVLPATTLADDCYEYMFNGCTSLTEAPALPATTLIYSCYYYMFNGCSSLTKAPELTATTLENYCCQYMFNGCSSLNEVRCKIPSSYSSSQISSYANNWLSGVAQTGTFYTNADANWPSGASGIPEGWTRVNEGAPAVDDPTKPLTFRATQDGSTVKLTKTGSPTGSFQTSRDGGNTWTDYTLNTAIALNTGDEVAFRAKADRSAQNASNYFGFQMTGKIEAWHNVMSMIRTNDFSTYNTAMDFSFYRLFQYCTSLTKAPVLPATTLDSNCYYDMFGGCASLVEAPELPATTLAVSCYDGMFYNCTSLTKAPALPATTLADDCYGYMFSGCSSLNEVRCKMPSSYSSAQISSYAKDWLRNVSPTGTFYTNADANWSSDSPSGIPTGWTRVNEGAPAVDGIRKPLTFRATQDGSTVKLTKEGSPDGSFQTSRDGGNTWTDYTIGTYITLNTGREVSFRAKADRTTDQTVQNYFYFEMTGKIEAWHNVMSLYRTNDFATYSNMVSHAFYKLFLNCTSLTKAPKLPVTTLAHSCYQYMFNGCTSLTKAPALPSTTLAVQCYYSMFSGCTSLTEAPALPATTLAGSCYPYMFNGCTSLTKTPALSATTLADHCYQEMFRNCSNLNEVRCKMSSSYSSNAISTYAPYWLSGVSSTGTFYTNADANWPSGDDGIPQTWTRANIDDYPTT